MVKNSEIKFRTETSFKESVDSLRDNNPSLQIYSKTGFYLLIFKLGLLEIKRKNFEDLEPTIEFKKKN